ncbi:hypothetical protein, partial [Thalassobaculum salexigens]|uniref:hypothetical protein n=1 Tax=Thalassobaculum salexigens TaxID=455360 RepID=UPI00248E74CE
MDELLMLLAPLRIVRLVPVVLLVLLAAAALTACNGGRSAANVPVVAIGGGGFQPLSGYQEVRGRAQVVLGHDGRTTVSLVIEGLAPGLDYPAHVHHLPCAVEDGGAHYRIDPSIAETRENNEIWPTVRPGADGIGRVSVMVDHTARMDAQSLVVHDPNADGARMACADLTLPADGGVLRAGEMGAFAAAESGDQALAGTVEMTTDAAGTRLTAALRGLDPAQEYVSHVHVYPCDLLEAGGHYKIDPSMTETREDNELWPSIRPEADGRAAVQFSSPHRARGDAQALVLHRVTAEGSPKIACADLRRSDFLDQRLNGRLTVLPAGTERGYQDTVAEARIVRRLDGRTLAAIRLENLTPQRDYPIHVHESACPGAAGGAHYKI